MGNFLLLSARPTSLGTSSSLLWSLRDPSIDVLRLGPGPTHLAPEAGGRDEVVRLGGAVHAGPRHPCHGARGLGARGWRGQTVGRVGNIVTTISEFRIFFRQLEGPSGRKY